METREIGSLKVSVVGLGCNNFGRRLDQAESSRVVEAALDAGINFFDTADIYGFGESEQYLGKALGSRREEVIVASKYGKPMEDGRRGARPEYIRRAVEESLRRLGTDYIDLYQQHDPDPDVPIEETLGALAELVEAGMVREVGCSNFDVRQLREAEEASRAGTEGQRARFVSVQNEYSLLHREPEEGVLEECRRQGMAFIPFYPLASGLLTGKYRQDRELPEGTRLTKGKGNPRFLNEENLARVESFIAFAEKRGHSLLELSFSWLLAKPTVVSVIAGASNPEQVKSNVAAAKWRMTADEVAEADSL